MIDAQSNWELLAKAVNDREIELGRPLTEAEKQYIREAMERLGVDPE